jgi:ABC-type enterobactin transport system permease subunit
LTNMTLTSTHDGTLLRRPHRLRVPGTVAAVVLVVVMVLAACIGPVSIGPGDVANTILAKVFGMHTSVSPVNQAIIWELRLPRIVLAALVGAMLSSSGAAYQGVLRNSLADPYLLGVAAGGGLGATIVIVYGASGSWLLPAAAFIGAVAAVVLTYLIASVGDRTNGYAVILAGVAVAAMLTAVQTFLQQQHTEEIRQIYNWLLGSFSVATWGDVGLALPYIALSMAGSGRAAGRGGGSRHPRTASDPDAVDHRRRSDARNGGRGVRKWADRFRRHHRPARRSPHDHRELPRRHAGCDVGLCRVPRPRRPSRPHR